MSQSGYNKISELECATKVVELNLEIIIETDCCLGVSVSINQSTIYPQHKVN